MASLLLVQVAAAQSFPAKPLKIVVPFGAGGVADLTARIVAQKLAQSLGQPVVIDNKPGAGGIVAADAVSKAEPDGYTLLLMSNGNAVSEGLFKSLPFDTVRDFAPISTLGFFDIGILTTTDSKFKTLGDLMAYAKANPGKLNLGSINIGSTQNLAAELFKTTAGLDLVVVPFNGSPAVITALRGGQIDASVEILSPVMPQVSAKVLRVLAVTGDKRAAYLPEVPTAKEQGVKGFSASSWNALAVPAKTPKDVVARLNREVVAALNSPEVERRLLDLHVEARSSTPEQASALLVSEIKRWGEVIERAKIQKQ
ncbi:MAG: tripartite tricarboxylate transporter receptor protein [Burkholderiales bacterium RIFCSPHIGHO2_12_FULL_61_11]|nr:MAG: tripartite tricarboxylate transporter receptor protein [Burkholderiales bacterium RIFCSPHIGHO2_12_FULL_61_11]